MLNKFNLGRLYSSVKLINSIVKSKNNSVTILNYHAIPDGDIDNFGLQIEWVKTNYKIISPQDFQDFLKGTFNINKHAVLITFDDGFLSSYLASQRFLNVLDIKALFFIPSIFVTEINEDWKKIISNNFYLGRLGLEKISDSFKPMSHAQIQTLINQGHTIGGHTHSHCDISEITSDEKLKKEILDPITIFANKFKIKLDNFAFPFGRINHINKYSFKKITSNYAFCFSNIRGSNYSMTSHFAIKRQTVSPDMPIKYLGFILEGGLDFYWRDHVRKLDTLAKNSVTNID